VPNFWAPVSQIVPVLALTLVIEARRLLRDWRAAHAVIRLILSFLVLIVGIVLWRVETWALAAMARGESDPGLVDLAQLAVGAVIAILALQPLANLFVNGNIDTWTIAWRVWPWSRWARTKRRVKRHIRSTRVELVKARELLADAQHRVDEARMDQKNFIATSELARTITSAAEQSNVPAAVIEEGRILLERGASISERDDRRIEEILDIRRQAKQVVKKLKNHLTEIDKIQADMKLGQLTEQERRYADSVMDSYLGRTHNSSTREPLSQ
jgi:hypothetical protein